MTTENNLNRSLQTDSESSSDLKMERPNEKRRDLGKAIGGAILTSGLGFPMIGRAAADPVNIGALYFIMFINKNEF